MLKFKKQGLTVVIQVNIDDIWSSLWLMCEYGVAGVGENTSDESGGIMAQAKDVSYIYNVGDFSVYHL